MTPVSSIYQSLFPFMGTIQRVTIDASEAAFDELANEVKVKLAMAMQ